LYATIIDDDKTIAIVLNFFNISNIENDRWSKHVNINLNGDLLYSKPLFYRDSSISSYFYILPNDFGKGYIKYSITTSENVKIHGYDKFLNRLFKDFDIC
jgi:hypothetical protein